MTSDGRIEIAEKMRGPFDVCECVGHTFISGNIFGLQVCAKDEIDLRNGMRHLAELIDPTCEFEESVENDELLIRAVSIYFCRACGHEVLVECPVSGPAEPPRYCSYCGARMVERGEADG